MSLSLFRMPLPRALAWMAVIAGAAIVIADPLPGTEGRVLGLAERFETLVPEPAASPMAQLKQQGRKRQRATGKLAASGEPKKWTWGEPV